MSAPATLIEAARMRRRANQVQAALRRRRDEHLRRVRAAGFTATCNSCSGPCHPSSFICAHCILD